jgi:hemerythrin
MGEPLQWSDSFAVGHATIDQQHRTLIQLINDVAAAASANGKRVAPLLKALGHAVREHFRTENAVLWELRTGTHEPLNKAPAARNLVAGMASAVFDDHIKEHITLLNHFDEVMQLPLETLGDTLKAWFVDHAIKQDAQLKTIFQAMR